MSATRISLREPSGLIATFFGIGLLPKAPGTWASLVAALIAWPIVVYGGSTALMAVTLVALIIGTWAADRTAARAGIADPGAIVIDEVVGQWLILVLIAPNPFAYAIAFVAFRIFDIWKPWPVSWADRNIKGGLGIMLDDILAAIYGLLVLLIYPYILASVS